MKKFICICAAVSLCLCLFGCTEKSEETMNYEQPLISLVGAVNAMDEESFLACYLPAAKDAYTAKEDYDKNFLEDTAVTNDGKILKTRLKSKITDSEELSDEELAALEEEYAGNYGRRAEFTKGIRLETDISFGGEIQRKLDTDEICVVRCENIWYIYGELDDMVKSITSKE